MSDPSSAPPTIRAIVAGHGDLAAGLVSAVAQITGVGEQLVPLTNRGRGADELEALLRAELGRASARTVFTDLPGGSWTFAARRVQRAEPDVVVVTGVNLALLLDWLGREAEPAGVAARAAADRARSAMTVSGGLEPGAAATGGGAAPGGAPAMGGPDVH